MNEKAFTLDELCALTGLPKRTVRYYMQIGLVSRPIGETRAAWYSNQHLEELLTVKRMSSVGMSLEGIRSVMSGEIPVVPVRFRNPGKLEIRSHLLIAPGLELQISPEEAKLSPEQIRRLTTEIMEAVQRVIEDTTSNQIQKTS